MFLRALTCLHDTAGFPLHLWRWRKCWPSPCVRRTGGGWRPGRFHQWRWGSQPAPKPAWDRMKTSYGNNSLTGLTHWGRVTSAGDDSKIIVIGSDNCLSPGRRQAIIWTNAAILLIWLLGTNFREMPIEINIFSFKKMHLKMSSWNGGYFVLFSMC